jgi:acetate kinase
MGVAALRQRSAGSQDVPLDVLVLNAGSTSLKLTRCSGGQVVATYSSLEEALAAEPPDAVAHRVVHGGDRPGPVVVDDGVLEELRALVELAPLHQPAALDGIERTRSALPGVPQVACFDTAFHATIPPATRAYALPERLRDRVRVYGFHGLSYAWSASRMRELAPEARRVVVAHLGGGQSLCGLLDGVSVTTTMGFTPLDGLVMATRAGAIDPGALLWLQRHTDEDLERVLDRESGLLGLTGTPDMRVVLERADAGDDQARFALDVYLGRLTRLLAGCVAELRGLDALVFTAGVGEHAAGLRSMIAERLAWLGVAVDPALDPGPSGEEITAAGAKVRSFVIPAREDLQAASETVRLLEHGPLVPAAGSGRP